MEFYWFPTTIQALGATSYITGNGFRYAGANKYSGAKNDINANKNLGMKMQKIRAIA